MELKHQNFHEINLNDCFFDSLKNDYKEFSIWFMKKAQQQEKAYVFYNEENCIDGFLYLKQENGQIDDVDPPLLALRRLKVGTFKINSHGTRLGEKFVKKIFDHAIEHGFSEIYVTIFAKHEGLTNLMMRYGFDIVGVKPSNNGTEQVLLKKLQICHRSLIQDYPMLDLRIRPAFWLPIYPVYHTRLLPDSILNNESMSMVQDVSHTNSVHKIYLTAMSGARSLRPGDTLIVYRTSDNMGSAKYRAVATSVCVVEEVRNVNEFQTYVDFKRYCSSYSVFDEKELLYFYSSKKYPYIIKFSYNVAFRKRLIRERLLEAGWLQEGRVGIDPMTPQCALEIMREGGVNESIIVY